jgi:hypothetical protein
MADIGLQGSIFCSVITVFLKNALFTQKLFPIKVNQAVSAVIHKKT